MAVLIIGLSGLIAQVLILRELLVSFYGNELTLGIVLANWIAAEAMGVFSIGKLIDRVKNKINIFVLLQIIFSLTLPLAVYASRTFKQIIGIPFGEGIGIAAVFYSSFLIILPVAFAHGALFSTACKLGGSISKIYSLETIGTILGGIIFTYIFLPSLNSFEVVFIICLLNIIVCMFFVGRAASALKLLLVSLILALAIIPFGNTVNYLRNNSIKKQWPNQEVLSNRNSIYGNITVTKKEGQYTFFYNGLPIITVPFPDKQFMEDFGNLPLLFHQAPKDVLIIGSGAGGLINEIIKHPVNKIDYVEIDPIIIDMLRKYPTSLTESELKDSRVHVKGADGRFFLKGTPKFYDVILIGLSSQSELSTNRLFTEEFFALARKRLNPKGILAIWLPGSLTYLSKELRDLNYCILNGLKDEYKFVRIIPGDYNIFLSSNDKDIAKVSSQLISQRIGQRRIRASLLNPDYINYRLSSYWLDWFEREAKGATRQINKDLKPLAVFLTMILWDKKFSPAFKPLLEYFSGLNILLIFIFVVFLISFLIIAQYKSKKTRIAVVYSIATTGFFAMLTNLILIFAFQTFYGYLYHLIGLLISIFMTGLAFGSIYVAKKIEKGRRFIKFFILLEILIILFSCLIAIVLTKLAGFKQYVPALFVSLFFICGLLSGSQFSMAAKIYLKDKGKVGETSGILYCADLLGGWAAGILGGIVLLPVLGLIFTCLTIIMLKASSLALFIASKKGLTSNPV